MVAPSSIDNVGRAVTRIVESSPSTNELRTSPPRASHLPRSCGCRLPSIARVMADGSSGMSDEGADRGNHEATHRDLDQRAVERDLQEAATHPGDRDELHPHHDIGYVQRG